MILTWVAMLDGKCLEPEGHLVIVPIQVVRRVGKEGIDTLTWIAMLDGNCIEPEDQLVNVPIQVVRRGGTEGIVTLTWVARLDGKCIEPEDQLTTVPILVVGRGGTEGILTLAWVARLDGNNYNSTNYKKSLLFLYHYIHIGLVSTKPVFGVLTRSYSNQQLLSYRDQLEN